MSTASKGAQREHAVKRNLEADGWAVTRGAGSHGCADLWAARSGCALYLIQVKGNAGSPWKSFGPREREELVALADQTDGVPWLVHWPPRGKAAWIAEEDWPRKVAA